MLLAVFLWLGSFGALALWPTVHPDQYYWEEKDGQITITGWGNPCWWFSAAEDDGGWSPLTVNDLWIDWGALGWGVVAALAPPMALLTVWTRRRCPRWRWESWGMALVILALITFGGWAAVVENSPRLSSAWREWLRGQWQYIGGARVALMMVAGLGTALLWEYGRVSGRYLCQRWHLHRQAVCAAERATRPDVEVSGDWDEAPR